MSGGVWQRDGLHALLAAVESGSVRRIFVEDLSRLSRDKEDAGGIEKPLAFYDVPVVTLDGMVYDGTVGSSLAFTFQSAGAAQYLKDLGAKTRRGLRGAHRNGTSTGGSCYGYRVEDKKLLVNEHEAAVVRRIFALYLQDFGYASIAQKLNAEGIPAPRAKRRQGDGWMHSCLREMVRNPKYIGRFSFGERKWQRHPVTRKRVARFNPDADVLRTDRPDLAIVDHATWDAVQAKLEEHARAYKTGAVPRRKASLPADGIAQVRMLWRVDADQRREHPSLLPLHCESKGRDLHQSAKRPRRPDKTARARDDRPCPRLARVGHLHPSARG